MREPSEREWLEGLRQDAGEQQQERELEIRREYIEEIQSLTAALKDAEGERERLRRALEAIAEGNLGEQPGQAKYDRIREYAREALQEPAPQGAEALGRSQPELTTPKDGS